MQLDFEQQARDDVAIARIREFEPPEGYYLAFSGGKDSVVLYHLTVRAGVAFDAHYHVTGIDPPELVQFIKANYPDILRHVPEESIFKVASYRGLPRRNGRWCCQLFKEHGGSGRRVLTGIRWAESSRRRNRRLVEQCYRDSSRLFVNPIIDWRDAEVWGYIREHSVGYCSLYDEGFKRLGCVLCPMVDPPQKRLEAERWPKIAEAWRRAAFRYWQRQTPGTKRFPTPEAFWNWWFLKAQISDPNQESLFT